VSSDSSPLIFRTVADCNAEYAWGLSEAALQTYAKAAALLAPEAPEAQIRTTLLNYHADHATVAALGDALHPDHEHVWGRWMRQVLGVLRSAGMAWSDDPAVEVEDLAQVARAELAAALPGYRYGSRFSSWAYRVVVQSVTRQIRRARAAKRAVYPESLEALDPSAEPLAPAAEPEVAASGRLLAERVAVVLSAQPDARLLGIFQQWAMEERGTAEIGALVRLHPSRVRALLAQARQALRADPVIRDWADPVDARDEAA
jgi:RNA polymerase sigma factor (sigma-70 family)